MGHGIIKIKDKYFEWSTVVDAPISYGMSLEGLRDYIREEYGAKGIFELPERLKRVDETGTSFIDRTLNDIISSNRAGENEKHLSQQKLYERYTEQK